MEIYRFLHQQGAGSRKECRELVARGLVKLNGNVEKDCRRGIVPSEITSITIDKDTWAPLTLPLYIMLHKPINYETSHRPSHYPSVFSLLPERFTRLGINAVGRLDADTTGLLLLTTDGPLIHALTAPRRAVAKHYRVGLKYPASESFVDTLNAGVLLHGESTPVYPEAVEKLDSDTLMLAITEGKYHQVKRMVAAASNRVTALHRTCIGSLHLDQALAPGSWRFLTQEELQCLTSSL